MEKVIHNFDLSGLYLGSTPADESPMEPGVFLIPALATDTPLPSHNPDVEYCRFDGASWSVEAMSQPEPEPEAIPPTQEQIIAQYERVLDVHLDSVARQHRYNDRFTFALRAGYFGPYQAEAIAFAQWMDDCNVQAFARMSRVLAGLEPMPTIEDLIAELPAFVKP